VSYEYKGMIRSPNFVWKTTREENLVEVGTDGRIIIRACAIEPSVVSVRIMVVSF
jgi:hypothetical protein